MRPLPLISVLLAVGLSAQVLAVEPLRDDADTAGRRIYQTYCASCHGRHGEGEANWQKPNEQGELPAPPHNGEGHTWKHGDGMLYRIIANGWRDPFNKTQRLTMPAFRQILSPQQIRSVIDYLKTLWTAEQQTFQAEESAKAPVPREKR